jgi:hypothetical protein
VAGLHRRPETQTEDSESGKAESSRGPQHLAGPREQLPRLHPGGTRHTEPVPSHCANRYQDALTGEGIALALATAGAAVRCLAAGRPDAYERAWARLTRRHRLLTGALLVADRRPATARLIVPAASRMPPVFSAAVHAVR